MYEKELRDITEQLARRQTLGFPLASGALDKALAEAQRTADSYGIANPLQVRVQDNIPLSLATLPPVDCLSQ